jgi:hypothetical protein
MIIFLIKRFICKKLTFIFKVLHDNFNYYIFEFFCIYCINILLIDFNFLILTLDFKYSQQITLQF